MPVSVRHRPVGVCPFSNRHIFSFVVLCFYGIKRAWRYGFIFFLDILTRIVVFLSLTPHCRAVNRGPGVCLVVRNMAFRVLWHHHQHHHHHHHSRALAPPSTDCRWVVLSFLRLGCAFVLMALLSFTHLTSNLVAIMSLPADLCLLDWWCWPVCYVCLLLFVQSSFHLHLPLDFLSYHLLQFGSLSRCFTYECIMIAGHRIESNHFLHFLSNQSVVKKRKEKATDYTDSFRID